MNTLSTRGRHIVDTAGNPVLLRGPCVGGWMNLENFILGFPGTEEGLRFRMAAAHGEARATHFFDRLLDYFFEDADIAFIRSCGATAVRIPLNYRHFERDDAPFRYLEKGFDRLARTVESCARHGLYVILDLHACQGWQNPDWHSDNSSGASLLWGNRPFQDRFVALWEELARRFQGNPAVAGYDLLNEPLADAHWGRLPYGYAPDWGALNALYRRTITAVRRIDPEHIIFIEGEYYASRFEGLEPPFAENLVYSFHDYSPACFGDGATAQEAGGENPVAPRHSLLSSEAWSFSEKHNVPLLAGEFGAPTNGSARQTALRLDALDRQMAAFDELGIHWTAWTYKDIGVMGWVQLAPDSPYMEITRSFRLLKQAFAVDSWMSWLPPTPVTRRVNALADSIAGALDGEAIDREDNRALMAHAVLSGYVAKLMQPAFAGCFRHLDEQRLEHVLQSFALAECRPHARMVALMVKHLSPAAADPARRG
jgi:endoglucanase